MRFRDRADAGRALARLVGYLEGEQPVVLGLPRGGVAVAAEVAASLHAPLDVLVVRKLGHPQQPELGVGAIAEGDVTLVNSDLVAQTGVTSAELRRIEQREATELTRRVAAYRGARPRTPVSGRTVLVVDDGVATGFTARAAVEALRRQGAARIVVAVPVASVEAVEHLRRLADEVVCVDTPAAFVSTGQAYDDFSQVSDAEVTRALALRPEL